MKPYIFLTMLIVFIFVLAGCQAEETAVPEMAPPTSEVEQEPEAEIPTEPAPTETPLPPTNTPLPPPTATPLPEPTPTSTPEADPRVELGNSAWGAVFTDGTQTWFQYENEQSSAQVKDGMLVVTDFRANSFDSWSMSFPVASDFYLEVAFTTGETCEGKDRFGFIFRAPDPNQGYLYNISCDGAYQLRIWDGEKFADLIKWTVDDHIIPGPDVTHRVGVIANGENLALYINGFKVNEISDPTFTEGTFGINSAAAETEGFTVYVTEAKLWELPAE